jgi:hypothetical protein
VQRQPGLLRRAKRMKELQLHVRDMFAGRPTAGAGRQRQSCKVRYRNSLPGEDVPAGLL